MKSGKSYWLPFHALYATDLTVYLIHTHALPPTIDHPANGIAMPIFESVLNTSPQH